MVLKPTDGRISFYGKCSVRMDGGWIVLRSYETDVAKINGHEFVRLWGGWSATTQRHINAFRERFGIRLGAIRKSEWVSMPVEV